MGYVALALLLVVAFQAAAIVALLVERRRRVRAERALRESEATASSHVGSRARHGLDGPARHHAGLRQPLLRGVHRAADREAAGRGLVERRASGRPGPRCQHLRLRRSRRAGLSSWSTGCAVPTAPTDGCWPRGSRCTGRMAALRVTSASTSTSPSGKNAEERTRESRAALEASHREIQQLAGRLIEAAGCRAGAGRARPARRREPAAGRLVDRPQRPQAPHGRAAGRRGPAGGPAGAPRSAPPRWRRTSVTFLTTCIPPCCGTRGWWPP